MITTIALTPPSHHIITISLFFPVVRTFKKGGTAGNTQRDGMEREVGGRIRMGNTCKSMADSCQCMAKTTTIL